MTSSTAAIAIAMRAFIENRAMFTALASFGRRAVLGLPAPPLHDERHVDLVRLVVEAQCVHHEVDAEPERQLALLLAAGLARIVVVAEVVARPCTGEIVRHVRADETTVAHDTFHRRRDRKPT